MQYENLNLSSHILFIITVAFSNPHCFGQSIDNTYQAIYLASNKSTGSSYNIPGILSKTFITDKLNIKHLPRIPAVNQMVFPMEYHLRILHSGEF